VYGRLLSRDEDFTGVKTDMSMATPFYAKGVYQISPEERKLLIGGKSFGDKARVVRFLGYARGHYQSYKNCFDVVFGNSNHPIIITRHDCWFRNYQEGPDLLSLNDQDRHINTYQPEEKVDYEPLFGNLKDPNEENNTDPSKLDYYHFHNETEPGDDSTEEDIPSVFAKEPVPPKRELFWSNGEKAHDDHIRSLESAELEIEVPWSDAKESVRQGRPTRIQKVDPRYKEFLETITKVKHKEVSPDSAIPATIPTPGYNLRTRINNKVYRQKPPVAAHLVKIHAAMQTLLPENLNPPPPIFQHIPKAPLGDTDPASLYDALQGPDRDEWWIGYVTEMERLGIRTTWSDLTEQQQQDKKSDAIRSTYACRCTQRADGTWKYRVRLCACGNSQQYGRDYWETFAPTAKFKSFNILMHLAAINDWEIQGLDIENAFIESYLDEEIYMYISSDPSRRNSPKKIVKLNRTLYGLRQAAERFYEKMRKALESNGFVRSPHDVCVFTKYSTTSGKYTHVLIYVDDIIITGDDTFGIKQTLAYIATQVEKLTDLGELTRFIGVDISRDRDLHTMTLTQEPYITKIQNDPIDPGKDNTTPLDSTLDYRQSGDITKSLEKDVGQLRYASDRTRPDIMMATSLLGSHARDPHDVHIRGAKRTKRYLRGTKTKGLVFRGTTPELNLFGMCDGSYIPYADSKSQVGFAIFLNLESGTIQARSHRDTLVSHSSFEIEIKALDELIRALVWVKGFLTDLGYDHTDITTPIYIDNEAAITIGNSYKLSEKNSHMVRNLNYIHQEVESKRIALKYIDTYNNVADILTKALPIGPFLQHAETLLEGFKGEPIIPLKTKTQEKLEGLPVTLKGTKRPLPDTMTSKNKK